ncbi:MAG: sigma-70 family RNA polymerase sigma factor [Chloroflexota bacterium]|nr:sigma-70 family RNA polymerase sigma factor [Chloroflexota bacterium]
MTEVDQAAVWEKVFRSAYPSMYRALVAVLLDAELAQDALQEAFEQGLRKPPPHSHALPGWLYRVALRRARRGRRIQLPFRLDEIIGSSHEPSIATETEALLDRLELGGLLRLLTERQRAVVVAHYYLGLTQQEIAAALGIQRGTVGATLSQALQQMRKGGSYVF